MDNVGSPQALNTLQLQFRLRRRRQARIQGSTSLGGLTSEWSATSKHLCVVPSFNAPIFYTLFTTAFAGQHIYIDTTEDLKLGEFKAEFKGQMELYLRYLEKYEMIEGERSPIGMILCTGKNEEHVELLQLNESNIRVAEYLTALPSRELPQQKLHDSIKLAKQKLLFDTDTSKTSS